MAETHICVFLCWSPAPRHVQEMKVQVPVASTVQSVLHVAMAQYLGTNAANSTHLHHAEMLTSSPLDSLQFLQPGIWGKKVSWDQVVKADDRIELYRSLKVDPKVARRQRFKRQGKGRTGLFANRKSGNAAGY